MHQSYMSILHDESFKLYSVAAIVQLVSVWTTTNNVISRAEIPSTLIHGVAVHQVGIVLGILTKHQGMFQITINWNIISP